MSELAPIIVFAYNRPWHVEQTLTALMNNEFADQSALYIYCDGAKENATESQKQKITEVRQVVRKMQWCKDVFIIESDGNKGLANSIIGGVTDVINRYGKVIVLEDDIVTSVGYLRFMNDSLKLYADDKKVAGVSGFHFIENSNVDTYFLSVGNCLGWGTWKRVWDNAIFDSNYWIKYIKDKKLIHRFNVNGMFNYYQMLKDQRDGKLQSWAINFYASYFSQSMLFLHPKRSMLLHIGYDEGSNCSGGERVDLSKPLSLLNYCLVKRQYVVEDQYGYRLLVKYYKIKKIKQDIKKTCVYKFYKKLCLFFI